MLYYMLPLILCNGRSWLSGKKWFFLKWWWIQHSLFRSEIFIYGWTLFLIWHGWMSHLIICHIKTFLFAHYFLTFIYLLDFSFTFGSLYCFWYNFLALWDHINHVYTAVCLGYHLVQDLHSTVLKFIWMCTYIYSWFIFVHTHRFSAVLYFFSHFSLFDVTQENRCFHFLIVIIICRYTHLSAVSSFFSIS